MNQSDLLNSAFRDGGPVEQYLTEQKQKRRIIVNNNGDGIIAAFGCFAILWWLFWVFAIFMIAADFFDFGIAITDKI